jgi:predicted metal-binding protein
MTLLICRTCPRYDLRASGEFGRRLAVAVARLDPAVAVRNVQCLGGCPDHGVVAVDGPQKARVRFTGLSPSDAAAVLAAAVAHEACPTGVPGDWAVPAELAGRISAVTLKRAPWADPAR